MFPELGVDISDDLKFLQRLNRLLPLEVSGAYDLKLIELVEAFFLEFGDTRKLSLSISLYEHLYKISDGFSNHEMQKDLIEIWIKIKRIWLLNNQGNFKVWYKIHLDGGGTSFASIYERVIKERFPNKKFFKTLEWCSGPGFIGFQLLASGITQYLALADINREALDCARRTVEDNLLQEKVDVYEGDNLSPLPLDEKFDLVVACPPWAYAVNNSINPLISSDAGWKLHEDFYKKIKSFLFPGGIICLTCFEPFEKIPYVNFNAKGPWDERPEEPILTFKKMIEQGGLTLLEVVKPAYVSNAHMGYGVYFIICKY